MENPTNNIVQKINEIIESIRPYINMDGGDIKFLKYEDNIVYVAISGACVNCNALDDTIKYGLLETLKAEIPEIIDVINCEI